jgi:hypothetical protein
MLMLVLRMPLIFACHPACRPWCERHCIGHRHIIRYQVQPLASTLVL